MVPDEKDPIVLIIKGPLFSYLCRQRHDIWRASTANPYTCIHSLTDSIYFCQILQRFSSGRKSVTEEEQTPPKQYPILEY